MRGVHLNTLKGVIIKTANNEDKIHKHNESIVSYKILKYCNDMDSLKLNKTKLI